MNWETIKRTTDAAILDGITVTIDKTDSTTNAVTLTDKSGASLRIRLDSYTLKVEIPAKPKTEKKFTLSGEYKGLPVAEVFNTKYDATIRRDEIDYGNEALVVKEEDVEIPW